MTEIDKTYYRSKKEFKLFGIKIFEVKYDSQCLDGKGEFISESVPNKQYFEQEFRTKKGGGGMLTFNLKKEWYDKIKNGEKTHEYREVKDYWTNRMMKSLYHEYLTNEAYFVSMCRFGGQKWIKPIFPEIIFRNGYPRSGQKGRELKAIVKKLQ